MNKNITILKEEAIIEISKNIYPKEVLIQASYVMLDECYFLLDEEADKYEISIKSKKDKKDLNTLALKFCDELIEASSYIDQLKRTSEIRQIILEKALLPQTELDKEEE